MTDRENKFKELLASMPNDKREELFVRLKKMPSEEREKAIDSLILRYEEYIRSKRRVNSVNYPDAVNPSARRSQVTNKTSSPSKAPNESALHRPTMTSAPTNGMRNSVTNPRTRSIKRELLVVALVLIIFTAICFAVKYYIDGRLEERDDLSSITNVSESNLEPIATVSQPSAGVPVETDPPTPTATLTPTPVPLSVNAPDLTGVVVVIDPGHQSVSNNESESIASWLDKTKSKATTGAVGKVTGICEYELTLNISLLLEDYLTQCGAEVILTRYTNDVDISNQERALIATTNNADVFIRIHSDSANDSYTSGVCVFVPDSGSYTAVNSTWGDVFGSKISSAIGLNYLGTKVTNLYTGLNYANTVPSFQISLGLLSNSDDEAVLISEDNQVMICAAIAEAIEEIRE